MSWRHVPSIVASLLAVFATAVPAHANRASQALCARAANEIYNLDRDRAIITYREAIAADPEDAAAHRGLASAFWLSITFRRGNMTVDDYIGRVGRADIGLPAPPPETAAAFRAALDRALALARQRVAVNPRDADARYQVGAAVGLRASYMATVEGSVLRAFRAAREAYDEHETVMELDGQRQDAGLIVGTYRYLISGLAMPVRWVAYAAGFGGGKQRGLQLVEAAARYAGENQPDARFALVLLYNREKRYDDALKELSGLRVEYPKNRLLWYEAGATALRAGRPADAERLLTDGLTRFADDTRQRMFGEEALWYYKRGAARAALHRPAEARQDLAKALSVEGRKWVHGRAHLELGKLALAAGDRAASHEQFRTAILLSESDNDASAAAEARRLMK